VIRRDNVGDLVCTTPLFAALVNSYNAAVLEGNRDLDAVYAYAKLKHRAPGESTFGIVLDRLRLFARLRRERFDHVVLAKGGFDRHGLARAAPGPQRGVAVHISAREPGRVWQTEKWLALIRRLDAGVMLLWSPGGGADPKHPGDDARAAAIANEAGPGVALLPANTGHLADLAAALSLCRAFIGADGGAMHVAAGLGLPVVALFENLPYKKRHWHPWQVPYEMVSPDTRDIADIPLERVVEAWRRLAKSL
jgi:heptosyltransferase III